LYLLKEITKVIGGYNRIVSCKKTKNVWVLWVADNKKIIQQIIKTVFEPYPPLTSRLHFQLKILNKSLNNNSINDYFVNRQTKFIEQKEYIHRMNNEFCVPSNYFNEWLSGFIEAESCFCIRTSKNHSFSIGQKDDFFLINSIKKHFNISTKIREKNYFFLIEVYNQNVLRSIIQHCEIFPLIGFKKTQLLNFIAAFQYK
jgi:hypothetical protein